jgi:hypothetical protein
VRCSSRVVPWITGVAVKPSAAARRGCGVGDALEGAVIAGEHTAHRAVVGADDAGYWAGRGGRPRPGPRRQGWPPRRPKAARGDARGAATAVLVAACGGPGREERVEGPSQSLRVGRSAGGSARRRRLGGCEPGELGGNPIAREQARALALSLRIDPETRARVRGPQQPRSGGTTHEAATGSS